MVGAVMAAVGGVLHTVITVPPVDVTDTVVPTSPSGQLALTTAEPTIVGSETKPAGYVVTTLKQRNNN